MRSRITQLGIAAFAVFLITISRNNDSVGNIPNRESAFLRQYTQLLQLYVTTDFLIDGRKVLAKLAARGLLPPGVLLKERLQFRRRSACL